jgi:hypothetical protein
MSLNPAQQTAYLKLLFQNIAWGYIGDTNGLLPSSTAGNFFISLHTADPSGQDSQSFSELATTNYTNYVRIAVARTSGGWDVTGNVASNHGTITFATGNSASGPTATYFGIGTNLSGAGNLVASGLLSGGGLAILSNVIPSFSAGALTITD